MDTEFPKTAVEYIHSLGRFSGRPGLHRIRALCKALGDPQDRLRFVHLAGTNGKGSTATMIASALQAAGLRTGLYTSPYLVQFYERIRIDGSMISSDDLAHFSERVAVACESLTLPEGETIGEFEFTTAVAFLYFVEQGCDIVVLETGLGGRCDATNVIRSPEVCVITPISLDHMAVLGDTVAEIAGEKAGIIKPGADVVCANGQEEDALAVLRHVTASQGAVWHESADTLRVLRCDLNGSAFVCDGQGYTIAMPGRHQLQNASTALRTLDALRLRGWDIPIEAAVRGLARARIAGRLERVVDAPLVLLDGAHNAAGKCAVCMLSWAWSATRNTNTACAEWRGRLMPFTPAQQMRQSAHSVSRPLLHSQSRNAVRSTTAAAPSTRLSLRSTMHPRRTAFSSAARCF